MKKSLSVIISIVLVVLSLSLPSFALTSGDYLYEVVDEKVVITGYNGTSATLIVPAQLDGKAVVKIGDNAFANNTTLTSITVSEGIEDIGSSAFENCTNLATITLPTTITHIGEKAIYNTAYYNNKNNWRLKKDSNVTTGDSIDWEDISASVLEYLYLGKNLIQIEIVGYYSIKSGTLVIADGAFKGNTGLIDVGLPTSMVAIGNKAFEGCTTLKSVRNMQNVKIIGDKAFKDCTSLEKIDISETTHFNSSAILNTGYYNNQNNWQDGVLYMGTRVVSSVVQEAVIKDGTTTIVGGAINSKNVVIPASVTNIENNAFISTDNVKIFGYKGTYAETYATNNNITFIDLKTAIKGDVNFNGKLDQEDYEILMSVASLQKESTYLISLIGDMNEDTTIDGLDVVILDLFLKEIGPSTIKGDADGNGEVNELDYDLLVRISSLQAEITDNYMFRRCDINEDGAVDSLDAVHLDLALNRIVPLV